MNRSVIVGRLTKDVDLRYTQNGKAVGNFTLAVNRPFRNQQTNDYDADFINCVAWGKQAENLAQYMKKGSQVGVDGRIQTRTYDDRDGKTVYVTEVVADNIQFLESKKSNNQNNEPQQQQENNPFEGNAESLDIDDSDLPF
ncbi:MAG TPA: single-stranded DNA-binding protein [Pseudogracilibacillus sp.]|nr:single-stranded DNA-binding protein [Pseudogracilibacillus sp.]